MELCARIEALGLELTEVPPKSARNLNEVIQGSFSHFLILLRNFYWEMSYKTDQYNRQDFNFSFIILFRTSLSILSNYLSREGMFDT